MPNAYSQISIHAVFAVKYRENLITSTWRDNLHRYVSGIISNAHKEAKPLAVGGWKDHIHVFFALPVTIALSDFIQLIKANSSKWINEQGFVKEKFQWQKGYGAFSYARSQRDIVIRYIMNQEKHHQKQTFQKEYIEMLEKFEVDYDEKYLFEFYE